MVVVVAPPPPSSEAATSSLGVEGRALPVLPRRARGRVRTRGSAAAEEDEPEAAASLSSGAGSAADADAEVKARRGLYCKSTGGGRRRRAARGRRAAEAAAAAVGLLRARAAAATTAARGAAIIVAAGAAAAVAAVPPVAADDCCCWVQARCMIFTMRRERRMSAAARGAWRLEGGEEGERARSRQRGGSKASLGVLRVCSLGRARYSLFQKSIVEKWGSGGRRGRGNGRKDDDDAGEKASLNAGRDAGARLFDFAEGRAPLPHLLSEPLPGPTRMLFSI
jgi:hypothetical protein